jgi:KDO2-lipid IV(A) lauroyltransferase
MFLIFFLNLTSRLVFAFPSKIIYGFSQCIAWFLEYVIKYRKKVITQNLSNAFPNLPLTKIKQIKSEFYRNLSDQFVEMLMMGANSYDFIEKKYQIDVTELNQLYEEGKSVLMVLGHQFNWEWGLWILCKKTKFHVQGVYMPIKNATLDAWLLKIRGKYGAEMVPAQQVRTLLKPSTDKPTLTLIIGDQSPANLDNCSWLNFLHQETAFINAYEKIARKRKMAVVFIEVIKKAKGQYFTPYYVFTKDASLLEPEEIVKNFVKFLEKSIQNNPSNWLWSHRRWKHKRFN